MQKQSEQQTIHLMKDEAGPTDTEFMDDAVYGDCGEMLVRYSPMVKIIVARMRSKFPPHADVEEMESAGMMGLLAAIQRFDPSKGYTFQTYASVRIRGAILDELRAMDMVPRSVRLKQRLLARTGAQIEQETGRPATDGEMRDALGMDDKAYEKIKRQTRPVNIVRLDGFDSTEEPHLHECIADDNAELASGKIEREELQELVARRIMELPEQQRKVLALYFSEGMRLAEIGEIMGLSEARICQIRSQAIESLRKYVNFVSRT